MFLHSARSWDPPTAPGPKNSNEHPIRLFVKSQYACSSDHNPPVRQIKVLNASPLVSRQMKLLNASPHQGILPYLRSRHSTPAFADDALILKVRSAQWPLYTTCGWTDTHVHVDGRMLRMQSEFHLDPGVCAQCI